jgi:DNA-binding MarR family transcriptional regulator
VHSLSVDQKSEVLRQTAIALVQRGRPELTTRQLGVFLTCYLMDDVQTVRDLCWKLNASKPAITRALDRLSELDLVHRKADPMDRRSVLIQRTTAGAELLMSIKNILADAAKAARERTTPAAG